MKTKKPKRGFMDGYKTYNPAEQGYGNVESWASAWQQKMGTEEANTILADNDPLTILGFVSMPTLQELKTRYRKLVLQYRECFHPEAPADQQEKAKGIIAAYTILLKSAK
jgi:hypothetical protein